MGAAIRAILDALLPQGLIRRPLINGCLWILFAIAFFQSGMAFTTWALEPGSFRGGSDWFWAILFAILLPAFLIFNRRHDRGPGHCMAKACERTKSTPGSRHQGGSSGVGPKP